MRAYYTWKNGQLREVTGDVVREQPLTVYVNGEKFLTLLCSPTRLDCLVVGYLWVEKVILSVDDIRRLTVSEVDYGTFHEYIPVTGNVVPRTTVYLDAVEGGQVTKVYVEEGAFVTAGEPLVEFKNSNLELSVISAEAQAVEQTNLLNTQRLNANQSRLAWADSPGLRRWRLCRQRLRTCAS